MKDEALIGIVIGLALAAGWLVIGSLAYNDGVLRGKQECLLNLVKCQRVAP